jgi:hypothetical protein
MQLCGLQPSFAAIFYRLYVGAGKVFESQADRYRNERSYLAKNNALSNCQELVEGNKNIIFVLRVLAVHIKLPDIVDA